MLSEFIKDILKKITNKQNIDNDIQNVNQCISSLISDIYFYDKIQYLINNKGKRIRSILSLYYYYRYYNKNSYNIEELYNILTIVELTHFASLLHDDVIDNSTSRRYEKSFNYLYGNKNSILIGDYLLISVFNNLLKILNNKQYSKYIVNQFIKASTDTAYGAYLEHNLKLNNIPNASKFNVEDYLRITRLKTGSLFKFSCMSGCRLSNTHFNDIKKSANFGLIFGIIYQIQNDLNDYKYTSYKESEDYMQHHITVPVVILQSITDIQDIFNNKTQENFNKIKGLISTEKFKQSLNKFIDKHINYILATV
ncbi:MAG: polyprenyl synthetase family protein [Alphaproteobacteria bacterium]|nr:polyprenyl synthetase family protein [Alphaproteobacteria bacterium]